MSRLRVWFVLLACLGIVPFAAAVDRTGLSIARGQPVTLETVKLETAGLKTWMPTNPGGGGAFNSPVIGPTRIWAVGSDLGGLSISRNQGLLWRAVGSSDGLTATHVAALAVDPRDGRWLIGTDDGLFTANPDGSQVKRRLKLDGAYVSGIAVAADPGVVYAAVHPAWNALEPVVYRSSDAGVSWARMGALPSSLRVLNLRTHPVDANAVIAISGEGRFKTGPAQAWRSNDAGATWQRFDPDLGPVLDVVFASDPDNLNRVYLSSLDSEDSMGKLWRSEDAGSSWKKVADRTGVILTDASKPGRLRLLNPARWKPWNDDAGVWESLDRGQSWRSLGHLKTWSFAWSKAYQDWGAGSSFQGVLQSFASGRDGRTILWADSQFVHASVDGGVGFKAVMTKQVTPGHWRSSGIDNVVPAVIAPSPANPKLVYAGFFDLGLWRSDDAGQSWIALNEKQFTGTWRGHGGNTFSVLPDSNRANLVWAQLGSNQFDNAMLLARSEQRGDPGSWQVVTGIPASSKQVSGLSLDPKSPNEKRMVFVTADKIVYRSRDDGKSFGKVLECACTQTWVFNGTVFAGGGGGLWRSGRNGDANSWDRTGLPSGAWTQDVSWQDNAYVGLNDLASIGAKELWAAVKGQGFYRSSDNGSSWTLVRQDQHARTVVFNPGTRQVITGSSSALYSGGFSSDSLGARTSSDGGKTWQANNQGLAYPFVTQIRVATDGTTWAASPGQGVIVQR
jgi:Sortilin, neurotensin receptor 3,